MYSVCLYHELQEWGHWRSNFSFTLPGAGATPIADFVTGVITVAPLGFQEASVPSAVNYYGGIFANDTFQVSPKLTITAGLRYEVPGGNTEKHDKNTVLLPQLSNPLVLVNTPAYTSRSDLQTHLSLFSPRVGLAFRPQIGTSVRAGYSLAFLPQDNWDFSVGKTTSVNDRINVVFRAEAFNLTNRTQFGDPNVNASSSLFGLITTQANQPRLLQFSLRANYELERAGDSQFPQTAS